jgi:hypothetical protein
LPKEAAEEILAEAGETLSWMDSVPDRTLIEEPLVPFAGSPSFQRTQLARTSPALAALIAEGNQHMLAKLTEFNQQVAAELTAKLGALQRPDDKGMKSP